MKLLSNVVLITLFLSIVMPVSAQEDLEMEVVQIEAEDGLMLVGDWYASDRQAPAVLLLHMLSSNHTAWEPLVPVLVNEYGFNVLNLDMRGHGDTGGSRDWDLAEQDVQTVIDWMRQQDSVDTERIAIVGASIGSNLAIRGWANDDRVVTAVALSPGLDYRGVTTLDSVTENADRPLLLLASRADMVSATAVIELFGVTTGDTSVRLFEGGRHGTRLFDEETLTPTTALIGQWLAEHLIVDKD
ncbi:MAG: alpha/beta fold hydrolase [Chloroflexi bacterium]|nr:alpha/beta fold hydrolase [Chloroflexota bacterium]